MCTSTADMTALECVITYVIGTISKAQYSYKPIVTTNII